MIERGREPGGRLTGAEREHGEHRRVRRSPEQGGDEVDRGRVGPMEVVQEQHERARVGQPAQERSHRPVRPVALVEHRRPRCVTAGDGREDPCELAAAVTIELRQPVAVEGEQVLVERVDEDPVGQIALQLRGASEQDETAALLGTAPDLGQEPRLAEAGIARDLDHGGLPRQCLGERVLEQRELLRPSDQLSHTRRHSLLLGAPGG